MEMLLGFIVLLVCLIVGVRHGGLGLAVISGFGLVIYTFIFGYQPGKPPIDVMLIILAVVTCAGFLQTSGGLTVMLKYAEKFLRNNPKHVTILAPLTTWFLTVLCGTGHVVYTMFPIIYDIAIKQGIRPERPMAVSSVASQMGICASPVSVAVVSMVAFLSVSGHDFTVFQVLSVSIPATGLGVFFAALWSYRRGKDLDQDERFQEFIRDPENKQYVYGDSESLLDKELPKEYYRAMIIFFIGIIAIAVLGNFPELLPKFPPKPDAAPKAISMVVVIQMVMLLVGAVILVSCKVKAKDVGNSQVFRSGVVALVSVYGVAWMADTYFMNHIAFLKQFLGAAVQSYPWAYAVLAFLTSKLVNSQGAAIAIVVPMAINVGVDPILILSFISACYGYFFLPTYPSDLACIGFDRSGTTRIGKYILNHSFMIPGLIGVSSGCCVGYVIAHLLF
ncbi:anaerobic C4-dicarboxylate transporter [Selenomonas sp. oral taxon 478]|uniref:anaerobic C4-dicarboxylate transporter n=1 Tax=Selenomonas sp. oral taxon 478 TaxID=712538 RepID=UPI00067A0EAC|nr:anaerobic C4-dicarboxylate transporter [Selenomonas sp. oral taxon 478]AKT53339.1 C4-dicarboxylate transporter [Selenomonas sp. oral taxon 478]